MGWRWLSVPVVAALIGIAVNQFNAHLESENRFDGWTLKGTETARPGSLNLSCTWGWIRLDKLEVRGLIQLPRFRDNPTVTITQNFPRSLCIGETACSIPLNRTCPDGNNDWGYYEPCDESSPEDPDLNLISQRMDNFVEFKVSYHCSLW